MRMWMIDPRLLCRKHLIGEHGELHKFRSSFMKKYKIINRISPIVQIEPASMKVRHDLLAEEMMKRGFNHNSPYEMPDISHLSENEKNARVDINNSIEDLIERCPLCGKNLII